MVHSGGSLRPDELPERQKALRQISVSECEFSKPDRLSQTSCLLHPDFLPQVKKISTLSDRHLPEGFLPLREFCLYSKRQFLRKKYKNIRFCYVKSLYFRYTSKIKKFRTKILVRNSLFWGFLHQTFYLPKLPRPIFVLL